MFDWLEMIIEESFWNNPVGRWFWTLFPSSPFLLWNNSKLVEHNFNELFLS